jgi:outer membrane protein assembly factor BamB
MYKSFAVLFLAVFPSVLYAQVDGITGEVKHRFIVTGNSINKIFIVNESGEIEWEAKTKGESYEVAMLPNGNILFPYRWGCALMKSDKEILWDFSSPKEKGQEIHSVQPYGKNSFIALQSGDINGTPPRIIFLDENGKVTNELALPPSAQKPHSQCRSIRVTPKGTFLVCYFGDNICREYDKKGKLLWEYASPFNCYSAVRLKKGNTLIGCGDGHVVLEVNKQKEIVWQLSENEIPGHPLRFVAGVCRLPNGNTMIVNWGGHYKEGVQPLAFEVTPDKKLVWSISPDAEKQIGKPLSIQPLEIGLKKKYWR